MNKQKNIIETVKNIADDKENQIGSSLGSFLESLIEIQAEDKHHVTSQFVKRYEQVYKANQK